MEASKASGNETDPGLFLNTHYGAARPRHVGILSAVGSVQPIAAQPKLEPSTQSRERAILTCVQGEVVESQKTSVQCQHHKFEGCFLSRVVRQCTQNESDRLKTRAKHETQRRSHTSKNHHTALSHTVPTKCQSYASPFHGLRVLQVGCRHLRACTSVCRKTFAVSCYC